MNDQPIHRSRWCPLRTKDHGTAYILIRRAEEQGEPLRIGAGDGVRLGMGVLGLLRLVSGFSDEG